MDTGRAASSAGLFCDHKKLRTTCPECRPPPPPPRPGRDLKARSRKRDGDDAPKRRTRVKAATREEAETAEAWWVKRDS